MARPTSPVPYQPLATPSITGGDNRFLLNELDRIKVSINTTQALTPQAATEAPKNPIDGMIRLARSPWRPIGGTVDAWVYWDAPSTSWKAL